MRFFKEKQVLHAPQCGFRVRVKVKIVRQGRKENISIIKNEKCSARKTQKMRHKNTIFPYPEKNIWLIVKNTRHIF